MNFAAWKQLEYNHEAHNKRIGILQAKANIIDPAALKLEPECTRSTHPDYRFMTPHERTEEFKSIFAKKYSFRYRLSIDTRDYEKMTGLMRPTTRMFKPAKIVSTLTLRENSGLWAARQLADLFGMLYNEYIYYALEKHCEMNRKQIPRPTQLLTGAGGEIVADHVCSQWEEWKPMGYHTSNLPQYRSEYYFGFAYQDEHRRKVLANISSLDRVNHAIANNLIDEIAFQAKFNKDALEGARERIEHLPISPYKPYDPPDRAAFFPGCFGTPLACDPANAVCNECPFVKLCFSLNEKWRASRRASNRGENAHVDRERENARRRQQKRREKVRQERAAAGAMS